MGVYTHTKKIADCENKSTIDFFKKMNFLNDIVCNTKQLSNSEIGFMESACLY